MSSHANAPDDPLQAYLDVMAGANEETLSSKKAAVRRLRRWCVDQDIDSVLDVEKRDIVRFLRWLDEEGYAGSTIRTYFYNLRAFYDEFTEDDGLLPAVLSENPTDFEFDNYTDISTRAKKQQYADSDEGVIYLSPEEVRELRKNVPPPKIRNELAIKMQVQTGMRASELCRLTIDRLDRDEEEVVVEDTKNDKDRTVPFKNLSPELGLWLDGGRRDRFQHAEDSPYVFVGKQSKHLTGSGLSEMVRKAADAAGIQEVWGKDAMGRRELRVTPHALRSTFIYRCFEAGMSVPDVMKLSGHTEIETVRKYAKAAEEDAADAYRKASPTFEAESSN